MVDIFVWFEHNHHKEIFFQFDAFFQQFVSRIFHADNVVVTISGKVIAKGFCNLLERS